MNIDSEIRKIQRTLNIYNDRISDLESKINPFVSFDFSILYQPGDGFVILHVEFAEVAPLRSCLRSIKEKKLLTYEQFRELTI